VTDDRKQLLESLEGNLALEIVLPVLREIARYIAGSEAKPPEVVIPVTTSDLRYQRQLFRMQSGLCQKCGQPHGGSYHG
jgi:hypothetical protein